MNYILYIHAKDVYNSSIYLDMLSTVDLVLHAIVHYDLIMTIYFFNWLLYQMGWIQIWIVISHFAGLWLEQ